MTEHGILVPSAFVMGTPGGREELGSAVPSLSLCRLPSCLGFLWSLLSRCLQVCGAVTMLKGAIGHQLRGLHPAVSSLYSLQFQCWGIQGEKSPDPGICFAPGSDCRLARVEPLGRGSQSEKRPTPLQTIHLLRRDRHFPMQGVREVGQVEWWVGVFAF